MYVEAVHRLNDHGALITQGAHGTSRDGFDAQWRMIQLLTVEGELVTHCELFDEKDVDAAIARFEQLSLPSRGWRTRQAGRTTDSRQTSRLATGTPWWRYSPTAFPPTIAVGWSSRYPTRSRY